MSTRKKPFIISILNHKGGVGKTTTTCSLGAALARSGLKVLLIDLDVQSNLTHQFVGDLAEGERTICDAMLDEQPLNDLIRPTNTQNLFLVPAGENLVELDLSLFSMMGREKVLSNCIHGTKDIESFDVVLIDNPPYISLTSINSLAASDYYLVPVSCEYLPMLGIKYLNRTVDQVRKVNPNLKPLGVLLTMYDRRETITHQIAEHIRAELDEQVFSAMIRVNTKIKGSPIKRQTIFEFENDPKGRGTQDYSALAKEVIQRLAVQERA
jgi:chromosome partitioning protein